MIQIFVTSPEIRELKGNAKVSGKPYHLRIQTAYAYTVDADGTVVEIPEKFEMMLPDGQVPYPRGKYSLHPSTLSVKDDRLGAGIVRLVPATATAPAAAPRG